MILLIPSKGALEPRVLVSGVVQDIVHVNVYVLCGGLVNEFLEFGFGLGGGCALAAIDGLYGIVILDVVGVVGLGVVHGAEPKGGGSNGVQIVQVVDNALEVSLAVAVGIGKAVNVELIGDSGFFVGRSKGGVVVSVEVTAVFHLCVIGVGKSRACRKEIRHLGGFAQIHVIRPGRKFHVVPALGKRHFFTNFNGRRAEVYVPVAVFTELELIRRCYVYAKCGVPGAVCFHGYVLGPAVSADCADHAPRAGLRKRAGRSGVVSGIGLGFRFCTCNHSQYGGHDGKEMKTFHIACF